MKFELKRHATQTWLSSTLALLLLVSCGEDVEIRSYTAPNHYEGPVVAWKLPEQWGENPGMSGMMAGSFHVKTTDGPRGRIGVMPFRESVETTSIVNMFARELGHADYNNSSLKDLIKPKKLADRTFDLARLEDITGKEKVENIKSGEIIDECTFPMVNEALLILEEGMAQRPSDIDVVWLNGYGFPRDKGGLLFWANRIGGARILDGLKKMEDSGMEIKISGLLKDMVNKNENIFDREDQKIRV